MTKRKQKQKKLKLDTALTILDDVLERYAYSDTNLPFWGKMPAVVIRELTDNAVNGEIEYNKAVKILEDAKTPKMRGDANRGMPKIKELWRKNYTDDTA